MATSIPRISGVDNARVVLTQLDRPALTRDRFEQVRRALQW